MRPGQWLQRKRRTFTRHVTERTCQGGSFKVRQYELCTRADHRPHCGQAARAAVVLAVIVSASASSASSSTCTPSGTEGNNGFEIRIALSLRHPRDQRFTRRSPPNMRKNQFAVSPDTGGSTPTCRGGPLFVRATLNPRDQTDFPSPNGLSRRGARQHPDMPRLEAFSGSPAPPLRACWATHGRQRATAAGIDFEII